MLNVTPLSPCSFRLFRAIHSVSETKNEAIHAALETCEAAKEWRSHVAIHFTKIAMVRQIDRIQADANLVPAPVLHERKVHMKISINLRVEGKESREARAIRNPYIILEHVDVGIGKTRVHVNHGTHRQRPREVHHSPADHAMGHIRRQDAGYIRANYGLLEWKENVGYRIQITARTAPNVGDIQVSEMNRLKMQRGLKLVIIRLARRKEAQQASTSEHARNRIHDEQFARLAVDIANANNRVGPQLAVNFDIADETAGTGAGFRTHS